MWEWAHSAANSLVENAGSEVSYTRQTRRGALTLDLTQSSKRKRYQMPSKYGARETQGDDEKCRKRCVGH